MNVCIHCQSCKSSSDLLGHKSLQRAQHTYVAFHLLDIRDFEVNLFSHSIVLLTICWDKRSKKFLPSLALIRALFATMLSISMDEGVCLAFCSTLSYIQTLYTSCIQTNR